MFATMLIWARHRAIFRYDSAEVALEIALWETLIDEQLLIPHFSMPCV